MNIRDYDDYTFNDDTSPSPNYNPGTPGYTTQESPNSNPYTPATPGSVYNPQEGYSPYQPSPSPSAGYQCKFHKEGEAFTCLRQFLTYRAATLTLLIYCLGTISLPMILGLRS